MIYRSPFPDIEIPVRPLHEHVFDHAGRWPDKPALDRRTDEPDRDLRAAPGSRPGGRGRSRRARLRARGRAGHLQPQPAGVRGRVLRRLDRRRGRHHDEPALHRRRGPPPAPKDSGARFLLTIPQFLGCGSSKGAEGTAIEEVLVFGEADGATPFASLMTRGRAARSGARPAQRSRGAALLERHHRHAQGRHADPLQHGRQRLADRRQRGHCDGRHAHRHPALLPHLRHDGDHERVAPGRRHRRHHAALRPRAVPRPAADAPGDDGLSGAARSCSPWPSIPWWTSSTSRR